MNFFFSGKARRRGGGKILCWVVGGSGEDTQSDVDFKNH